MRLNSIYLQDFRNFRSKAFKFTSDLTVIIGPNASGKTNILEAIYLLATGRSFKARIEEEMIVHEGEIARVQGEIENDSKVKLEVMLTRGQITRGSVTERTARKRLVINGSPKRLVDFSDQFSVVVFRPQDIGLITDSPSVRRKFIDSVLFQVDREYRRSLLTYEKGITRRNRILLRIREEGISRQNLYFWDKLIIKNGEYITKKRAEFIDYVNKSPGEGEKNFSIEYDKSIISEGRIKQYEREEVSAGTTLVGPHRDDFVFKIENNSNFVKLNEYGSRGEQRMGVLWIKLAELSFLIKHSNYEPILLLDDIFSELDHEHREVVMSLVNKQQTIMTTADKHFLEGFGKFEIIELKE